MKLVIGLAATLVSTSAAANSFLMADGMLNFDKLGTLYKAIKDKVPADAKPASYYVTNVKAKPVAYSKSLEGKEDLRYMGKRATKVVGRKRVTPDSLARVKIVFVDYSGTDAWAGLTASQQAQSKLAVRAITAHSKKIDTVKGKVDKIRTKARAELNKVFDVSIQHITDALVAGGVKEQNIVVGQSMFGRTVLVKFGPDNFVSISPADAARFRDAKKALTSESSSMTSLSYFDKDSQYTILAPKGKYDPKMDKHSKSNGVDIKEVKSFLEGALDEADGSAYYSTGLILGADEIEKPKSVGKKTVCFGIYSNSEESMRYYEEEVQVFKTADGLFICNTEDVN